MFNATIFLYSIHPSVCACSSSFPASSSNPQWQMWISVSTGGTFSMEKNSPLTGNKYNHFLQKTIFPSVMSMQHPQLWLWCLLWPWSLGSNIPILLTSKEESCVLQSTQLALWLTGLSWNMTNYWPWLTSKHFKSHVVLCVHCLFRIILNIIIIIISDDSRHEHHFCIWECISFAIIHFWSFRLLLWGPAWPSLGGLMASLTRKEGEPYKQSQMRESGSLSGLH